MPGYRSATVSISLLALALAGCNKSAPNPSATSAASADSSASGLPALPAALPMQSGPATSLIAAPPVAALPVRRAVRLARPANDREAYAYLDRASDIEDEIGNAPPDYDYQDERGVSPYVWQTNGGDYRYAEPADGGYRYYYYQPGAQYPYLVRTHDYSYAYAGAALVAVYALSGALLSPDRYDGYRDQASRYFWRGQQLRQGSDQREHQGVNAANWAAQRAQFSAEQANLAANRAQQAEWQAYHAQNDPSRQPGWQQERQQRSQVAQQFSGWQARGFAGSPPSLPAPRESRDRGFRQADQGPSRSFAAAGAPDGHFRSNAPQGFARPDTSLVPSGDGREHGPQGGSPMAGQIPNGVSPAKAAHEQQLAVQQAAARHRAQASLGLIEARAAAQQQANARHEAAARQQMIAEAQHQQEMAAQQETAGRPAQLREVQQRQAQLSAHQAQLSALAAQRQAEAARIQEARAHPEALGHERPQPVPRGAEHAGEFAPAARPEGRPPVQRPPEAHRPPQAQRPAEAPRPAEAQRPAETRPAAPHPEVPHPGQAHAEPGHEHDQGNDHGHDHEHHD